MFWFALASLMSIPLVSNAHLPDVRAVFSADDFPDYLQRAGVSRIVYTRTVVKPDGTIQACVTEVTSGDRKLDALTCNIILKRAKFVPAKWPDGTAVYGVIRMPISWLVTDGRLPDDALVKATAPDLDITVKQLPAGAHSIVGVTLEVATDETGHAKACAEYPRFARAPSERDFPNLVSVACEQVMRADDLLIPPVDGSGKPARSIQTVSVHFSVGR